MNPSPEAPSDAARRKPRSFEFDSPRWWLTSGIWMILIPVAWFWLTRPMPHHGKKANQTEAVNNARQIGLALFAFKARYGSFPSSDTLTKVKADVSTDLHLGEKSSNDFFRQLLASGIAQSENMFYAETAGSRKPDGVMTGSEALKKGECGFAYLANLEAAGNPHRPLVATPLIPGTGRFDPDRFAGKAVVLHMDNSVRSYAIQRKTGHALGEGRNLLDPSHPVWEGKPPVIVWQE